VLHQNPTDEGAGLAGNPETDDQNGDGAQNIQAVGGQDLHKLLDDRFQWFL
jgi:hypothetical protein